MTRRAAPSAARPKPSVRRDPAGGQAARSGPPGAPTDRTHADTAAPVREAYHHGALRQALIDASESLLAERGVEGFSLREVARRIGVSPAAPAHHFGDTQGLLAAVARHAFDDLTAALEAGNARGGSDPVARLREQGIGYVGFALRHPGRFGLMFRTPVARDEALAQSAHAAFVVLENGVRALCGLAPEAALGPREWRVLVSTWSIVHGFAHLALAGQFDVEGPVGAGHELLQGTLGPTLDMQLRAVVAARERGEDERMGAHDPRPVHRKRPARREPDREPS